MAIKKQNVLRAVIIGFYTACLLFLIYLLIRNPLENDIYHFFGHNATQNGYHCPSCGLTRAVYCLMTFQFGLAFYYHAFFVCTSPFLAYVILTLTVNLFFGKKILPYPKKYYVYLYVYLGLYVAFAILRNFTTVIY